jgi:hypothetical protein
LADRRFINTQPPDQNPWWAAPATLPKMHLECYPSNPEEKWLLKYFPSDCVYPPYCEGLYAFSGSIKNQHLLYALFHVLSHQVID